MPAKKQTKNEAQYVCCCCGKNYPVLRGNFRPSKSPRYAATGFLPICNTCLDKELYKYDELYNDTKLAMKRLCMAWDIYFNEDLYKVSRKGKGISYVISGYFSQLNFPKWGSGTKTYDDTLIEEEKEKENITSIEDGIKDEEGNVIISPEMIAKWGTGFTPEEYKYLENSFGDWKAKVVIDSKARECLVRDLCIIKLQQNKALQNNDVDSFTKLGNLFQKTLASANLQPIQEDASDKTGEKPLGVMIQMFENERPIPNPDPEWEDVDGIVRFITIYFLGHLSKMLGIKNKYAAMYEEEMDKYRAEVPELEDADDDGVFDYIINGSNEATK